MIEPHAIARALRFRMLVFGLSGLAACAFAQERPGDDNAATPFIGQNEKWDVRFAQALGLPPTARYARGVVRFSRLNNTRYGPVLILEIADLGDGKVLLRRVEGMGGYGRPYKAVRTIEGKAEAPFQDIAFAMLDRLTAREERSGIKATGIDIEGCSIDGNLIAVSIETREELPQSLTRYNTCKVSTEIPEGLFEPGVKIPPAPPPFPDDPVPAMEAMFEAFLARYAGSEKSGK